MRGGLDVSLEGTDPRRQGVDLVVELLYARLGSFFQHPDVISKVDELLVLPFCLLQKGHCYKQVNIS